MRFVEAVSEVFGSVRPRTTVLVTFARGSVALAKVYASILVSISAIFFPCVYGFTLANSADVLSFEKSNRSLIEIGASPTKVNSRTKLASF